MTTTPKQMTLESVQDICLQWVYATASNGSLCAAAEARIKEVFAELAKQREKWIEAIERALPFLDDEARKYEDDGNNEPLDVADTIRGLLDAARQENKP